MRQQHNTRLMKRPVGAALIANRKHSHKNKPTQQAAKMVRPKTTKPAVQYNVLVTRPTVQVT